MRGCSDGFIAAIILLEGSGLVALACMAPVAGHSGREIKLTSTAAAHRSTTNYVQYIGVFINISI
jgi:hypothetical protein